MPTVKYLLDANIFIQAHRTYYNESLGENFWECLKTYGASGRVQSIDKVHDELKKGKDWLSKWACDKCPDIFNKCDHPDVLAVYGDLQNWAARQTQFIPAARS